MRWRLWLLRDRNTQRRYDNGCVLVATSVSSCRQDVERSQNENSPYRPKADHSRSPRQQRYSMGWTHGLCGVDFRFKSKMQSPQFKHVSSDSITWTLCNVSVNTSQLCIDIVDTLMNLPHQFSIGRELVGCFTRQQCENEKRPSIARCVIL